MQQKTLSVLVRSLFPLFVLPAVPALAQQAPQTASSEPAAGGERTGRASRRRLNAPACVHPFWHSMPIPILAIIVTASSATLRRE